MQNENPDVASPALVSAFENIEILGLDISPTGITSISSDAANASPSATSTTLRYQTFIPEAYVPAPPAGCSYYGSPYYYKGDSRSFSTSTAATYRTKFDVTVSWTTPAISSSRIVGQTKVFKYANGTYTQVDFATASSSSMVLTTQSVSSTKAVFKTSQDVHNPFCIFSNGIYFDLNVTINRSGTYSISGLRLKVPNHEIYIKDSDQSTWTGMLQAPYLYFEECLTPITSTAKNCLETTSLTGSR